MREGERRMKQQKERRNWILNRLKRNKRIYQITIEELMQGKYPTELSYPESIKYNINRTIPYKSNISMLKEVIKNINKSLRRYDRYIIKSSLIWERRQKLEKHLAILRKEREERNIILTKPIGEIMKEDKINK